MRSAFFVALCIGLLNGCSDGASPNETPRATSAPLNTEPEVTPQASAPGKQAAAGWVVHPRKDGLSGVDDSFASLLSKEAFELESPYEGKQHAWLSYSIAADPRSVIPIIQLHVERGQFFCTDQIVCHVRIRIDDSEPSGWAFKMPSNGDTDWINLGWEIGDGPDNSTCVAYDLLNAKHILIQPSFYRDGDRTLEFDVEGLARVSIGMPTEKQLKECLSPPRLRHA